MFCVSGKETHLGLALALEQPQNNTTPLNLVSALGFVWTQLAPNSRYGPWSPDSGIGQHFSNMPSVKWPLGFAKVPVPGAAPLLSPCPRRMLKNNSKFDGAWYHPKGTFQWRTCEVTQGPKNSPNRSRKCASYQARKDVCAKAPCIRELIRDSWC